MKRAVVFAFWLLAAALTHAFYNPNTGRWLDRDPLLDVAFQGTMSKMDVAKSGGTGWEAETLQLEYAFVGNVASSRIDMLGLCGPGTGPSGNTCGKDVTQGLLKTQANVMIRYNLLGYWKQKANCQPWSGQIFSTTIAGSITLLNRALTGWDISLITYDWDGWCADGACGRGSSCKTTVYVNRPTGGCYFGWDVNYALFGWMSSLCGFSEHHMDLLVFNYKTVKHPVDGGDPEQARAFAHAGYLGWPAFTYAGIPNPPEKYSACQNCGHSLGNHPMSSTWPHAYWNYVWW